MRARVEAAAGQEAARRMDVIAQGGATEGRDAGAVSGANGLTSVASLLAAAGHPQAVSILSQATERAPARLEVPQPGVVGASTRGDDLMIRVGARTGGLPPAPVHVAVAAGPVPTPSASAAPTAIALNHPTSRGAADSNATGADHEPVRTVSDAAAGPRPDPRVNLLLAFNKFVEYEAENRWKYEGPRHEKGSWH